MFSFVISFWRELFILIVGLEVLHVHVPFHNAGVCPGVFYWEDILINWVPWDTEGFESWIIGSAWRSKADWQSLILSFNPVCFCEYKDQYLYRIIPCWLPSTFLVTIVINYLFLSFRHVVPLQGKGKSNF